MKRFYKIVFLVFMLFISNKIYSIEAFIQPSIFYTTNLQPYAEIRIFISSKGFKKIQLKDSTYIYSAVITLLLKRADRILNAERIVLTSPASKSPGPLIHQIRWPLNGSNCELETKIEDEQDTATELTLINKLTLQKNKTPFISDIQLSAIAKSSSDSNQVLYKNGIYSEPLVYHHYKTGENLLYAYFESYSTLSLGKTFFLKFVLSRKDSTGAYIAREEWYKKREAGSIDPYLLKHDISSFITGAYKLSIQILNANSVVINEHSVEFTKDNPFWDKLDKWASIVREDKYYFDNLSDSAVNYSIRSMYPLISSIDVSVINDLFKKKKLEEKRIFLFDFWTRESDYPRLNARTAFQTHMTLAEKVDKMFYSGFGYGFETDRGFFYLKYGNPDEIISEDKDNGAFPYEIWKYNKIALTGQTNVKFLFYNPDLAGSDFRLLHSTAHGERHNKRWEIELYKNAPTEVKGNNPIDDEEMHSNFNRRAREYLKY